MVKKRGIPWWEGAFWFAILVGVTARLGDEVRLYDKVRWQREKLEGEIKGLHRRTQILQNKLAYLRTPDGVRFILRMQGVAPSKREKLYRLTVNGQELIMDIVAFIPGGVEEWQDAETDGAWSLPFPLPPLQNDPP